MPLARHYLELCGMCRLSERKPAVLYAAEPCEAGCRAGCAVVTRYCDAAGVIKTAPSFCLEVGGFGVLIAVQLKEKWVLVDVRWVGLVFAAVAMGQETGDVVNYLFATFSLITSPTYCIREIFNG